MGIILTILYQIPEAEKHGILKPHFHEQRKTNEIREIYACEFANFVYIGITGGKARPHPATSAVVRLFRGNTKIYKIANLLILQAHVL